MIQDNDRQELLEDALTFGKVEALSGFSVEVLVEISYLKDPLEVRDTIRKKVKKFYEN